MSDETLCPGCGRPPAAWNTPFVLVSIVVRSTDVGRAEVCQGCVLQTWLRIGDDVARYRPPTKAAYRPVR